MIGVADSAFESGHPSFAAFTIFWNVASSTPATFASIVSAMFLMVKPSP